jgi:hypothetical protein
MLQRSDLWSLEEYSEQRADFRKEVLTHKQDRRVILGDHVLLTFEDSATIKYQIQEMLRIEKIFEATGIQEELDAYNPLIPDGDNWKCTMLIQYEDVEMRKRRLTELVGIEDRIWVQVGDSKKVFAIADEDMQRSNDDKTSAVHFMRYQLDHSQIENAKSGAGITFGVEHLAFPCEDVTVNEAIRCSLVADLN